MWNGSHPSEPRGPPSPLPAASMWHCQRHILEASADDKCCRGNTTNRSDDRYACKANIWTSLWCPCAPAVNANNQYIRHNEYPLNPAGNHFGVDEPQVTFGALHLLYIENFASQMKPKGKEWYIVSDRQKDSTVVSMREDVLRCKLVMCDMVIWSFFVLDQLYILDVGCMDLFCQDSGARAVVSAYIQSSWPCRLLVLGAWQWVCKCNMSSGLLVWALKALSTLTIWIA